MKVTVRSILEIPGTGLELLAGATGLDSEVRWVHVSDVQDPTPWVQGGEFLLTTAVRLGSPESMVAYVEKLHEHGIAGIGFGIGEESWMHSAVPERMRERADQLGMPLIEVPFDTPFIVIAEYVAAQQAAERFRVTQLAYRAQQQLTHIALSGDAIGGLVSRLAELTGGWASVVAPSGQVLEAYPAAAALTDAALLPDLERVRESGTAVSVSDRTGKHISIHPLGAPGRVRGMLLLGQQTPPDTSERMIIASAASLLSFVLEQRLSLSPQRMAAANLLGDTLLDPDTSPERFSHAAAGLGLNPTALLTLARVWIPNTPPESVIGRLHDVFSPRSGTSIAVQDRAAPGVYSLITTSSAESEQEFGRLAERFEGTAIRIGIGEPARLSQLHLAYNQAALALSHARRRNDTHIVHFRELRYYDRIIGLAPPAALSTFTATALAPLEKLESSGQHDALIETLRAFLAHHGRWDPAARQLGIHRQTLVKRITRIEGHLDADLDSPDIRMGLWFALAARDAARTSD